MNQSNVNFNVNPGVPGSQQYAAMNPHMTNTNVLATSVNLSSIQSLTDLLIELPVPQENHSQFIKEQVLITSNEQKQHFQSNLNNELVQHYLTHQLTNPLLVAKQQMQEMNLVWTNKNIIKSENKEDQIQFTPEHQANALLLKFVKEKNIFHDHVVLPPIRQSFNNQSQQNTPTHQFNEPLGRQTRSQGQAYWNPFINEQQNPQNQQPINQPQHIQQQMNTQFNQPNQQEIVQNQQMPINNQHLNNQQIIQNQAPNKLMQTNKNQMYSNDNSNSNSSFADNNNLVTNPMISPSTSNSYVNSQQNNFNSSVQNQFNQPQNYQSPSLASNKVNNQASQDYKNVENGQSNYQDIRNQIEYDDSYSSLGDRVKSKKRTNRVNNYVENQSNNQSQINNNQFTNSVPESFPEKTNVYNELNSLINSQSDNYTVSKKSKNKTHKQSKEDKRAYASSPPESFAPQLASANLSVPPTEKFEAMLNELFNINSKSKKKSDFEDDEDDDDERKKKKKLKAKLNGEGITDSDTTMFDITLNSSTLLHFINLTAKLKKSNLMKTISTSKLSNLLTVLTQQIAIQKASLKNKRKKDTNSSDEEDDEDSSSFSMLLEKFEQCSDCCLVALNIMTSKGMSSKIYLEECIEQIVAFINCTISQYTSIGSALTNTSTPVSTPKKSSSKGSKKNSSSNSIVANKKVLFKMYNKWSELVSCLVELMNIHAGSLTDTLVLATTRVALNAFFLENLNINSVNSPAHSSNEIQLNALKLTTVIFSQYIDHRIAILEEIIHSISRLSKTKRGRVYYKVEGDDKSAVISMFSALSFKLIQCIFSVSSFKKNPENIILENGLKDSKESAIREKQQKIKELRSQYDDALKISYTFLNSFLKKCVGSSASSESDFRVLFEDLVNDLMIVLHKPNWPAAQLISQTLIKLLINNVSGNTSTKSPKGASSNAQIMSQLKLTSLDHLGTLCSRYAKELSTVDNLKEKIKESLTSLLNNEISIRKDDENKDSKKIKKDKKKKLSNKTEPVYNELLENPESFIKELWKHLMRYSDEENLLEEKNLFSAIWLREMEREFEQKEKSQNSENNELENSNNNNSEEIGGLVPTNAQELFSKKARKFISIYKNASNPAHDDGEYRVIDYKTAESIVKYFDITQPTTTKSFEFALAHVIATLSSTSNTIIRSRAMKSLSTILNNAPQNYAISLLSRSDLQKATKAALLDASSSVREATIDLIGKFILKSNSEELIDSYYEIITERILDAGVSVRKRVIKILREICMSYSSYKKIPEICSKIIKRINDDGEGIRKLVSETFTSMWFKEETSTEDVKLKVNCILHVVETVISERIGTEWLNQLLTSLLASPNDPNLKSIKTDDDIIKHQSVEKVVQVTNASTQIVNVLIRDVLCSMDLDQPNNYKSMMLSAMTTIWLFGKVCPKLLVDHISTIQSYLTMRCNTSLDIMIMVKVVQIIENVLPKLINPSEYLLTGIEEELTKNILQSSPQVLLACVSCLSSLIHTHTKNKQLAQDLFKKFFNLLSYLSDHPEIAQQKAQRPKLLRSLFTCGLFAKYFEFIENKEELFNIMVGLVNKNCPTIEEEFRTEESYLTEFSTYGSDFEHTIQMTHVEQTDITKVPIDLDLLLKALTGLGFMFERNPVFSLREDTQKIYKSILNKKLTKKSEFPIKFPEDFLVKVAPNKLQFEESTICCVLKNLTNYLSDELNSEMSLTIEWSKENLKSMVSDEGDTNSVQSSIIQLYLDDVVKCTLSPLLNVRKAAVNLIHIIHNGGIVHPLQLVPYLIAMSSDDDIVIRARADHVLHEIERKYHGFVSMKAKHGITLSYQLHSASGKRGFRIDNVSQSNNNSTQASAPPNVNAMSTSEDQYIIARLSTLYSVVSNNRQSRRAFIGSLLKHFEITNSTTFPQNSMEDQFQSGEILQYICDNLIWLPYSVWDEPLYILYQLELSISSNANHSHSLFKEILLLEDDDDDELDEIKDEQKYVEKLNRQQQAKYQLLSYTSELAVKELNNCLKAFYLLNWAKQIFRELFSITDAKMQDYSPNEVQKVWDKQLHRKNQSIDAVENVDFGFVGFANDEDVVNEQD
ncbi:hypothetical protein RND71_044120 [Anisodus tanguticus]|uniref:Sister chromatid cohesion protein n=1 Tax=Anisodus tanguticus TaxID=243964 RepID=A0AAE1QPC5_9SOLA|nr:hypothetical protein RND71_044120 [Anisodus tanguticus]